MRLPAPVLVAIAAFYGVTHGFENTADIANTVAMPVFLPGVLVAGLSVVVVTAAAGVSLQRPWQRIAIRVAGSWIAAIGLLALGVA